MKKRLYLSLVIILAIAALLWWLWPRGGQPLATATHAAPQPKQPPAAPSSAVATTTAVTPEDVAKTPWEGTDEQKRTRVAEVREIMNQANQPVSFWGQVIDQDNAPLPGVRVKLGLKRTRELLPGATQDMFDYIELTTDDQGMFNLLDRRGSLLGVEEMKKDGYKAGNVSGRAFWYAHPIRKMLYTPDKQNPEVFRMWKLAGAEKLVNKGIGTRIPYDGRSVNFDLLTGQEIASGGDVRVTLTRTPLQIKRGQQKYDWNATIEAVDGGIIASNDEFMYRAPESGYEPKVTLAVTAQDPNWSSDKGISFYLKSRGKYSRVKAEFTTDSERPMTGFSIEAYTNPSGSRNLEYDPLQNLVKPPPASKR